MGLPFVSRVSDGVKQRLLALLNRRDFMSFMALYNSHDVVDKMHHPMHRFRDVQSHSFDMIREKYGMEEELNASFIDGVKGDFIAMEYPLDCAISSVHSLVDRAEVPIVISLIGRATLESDFLRGFCRQLIVKDLSILFPDVESSGDVEVEIFTKERVDDLSFPEILERKDLLFRISCSGWMDMSTPSPKTFACIYSTFRETQSLLKRDGPTVIHCLAGVGRTGTFIFYTIFREMDERTPSTFLDLFLYLRSRRSHSVQTPDQLQFLHSLFFPSSPPPCP